MRSMPLPLSSGDPLLDRRLEWARGLMEEGEAAAAAALLAETTAAAPGFLAAWFALGEACEQSGALDEAAAAFRRAFALDPTDRLGASVRLARLGAEPATMPPAYVRALFDQYAPRFDRELVDHLSYRGPAVVLAAIDEVAGPTTRFARVLDLGCGTGLMGAAIRSRAGELVGVDLSPAMLAEAQAKGLYEQLIAADLSDFPAGEVGAFDLIVAADVLVYFPDLAPVIAAAARALVPGGLFAFTLEHGEGESALGEGLRYAHGEGHLRSAAAAAGLAVCHLAAVSTRSEKAKPVTGLAAVLSRGRTAGSRQDP
jgi:predicted TPR repeat methyltransferase